MATCKLKRTPGDAICDFQASSPGEVTLEVKGTKGSVTFDPSSTYSGGKVTLSPTNTQITFTVVTGHTTLTLGYIFTDTANGAGTLNEVCDANTVLDSLIASIREESYCICA